ncbi:MAG: dipicolinate synthase subunit A [Ruminococcus sp.]|nr:dipicolinate synthase subunit A [Ruminococcus sp.]
MNEISDILIAGGDMRQIYCARRLSGRYGIGLAGFGDEFIPMDMLGDRADMGAREAYDCAVLPVVPLDGDDMISAPCSSAELRPEYIRDMLIPGGLILAGKADDRLRRLFPDNEIVEYMSREELCLKNAIPTAEGAVQIALGELPVTLSGQRVLIVGMGRIGTALAAILKGFGADVTAAVRNGRGEAKARIAGIKCISSSDIQPGYGLVFNTVPELIFSRELLKRFGNRTLFIDLASKPGGIDFKAARELGIRTVWALGLPGKTAPVTAGEMTAETIMEILAERSESHG